MEIVREIFPGRLQERVENAVKHIGDIQEIRIRVNSPIALYSDKKEYYVTRDGQVTTGRNSEDSMLPRDLEDIVYHICRSSLYRPPQGMRGDLPLCFLHRHQFLPEIHNPVFRTTHQDSDG